MIAITTNNSMSVNARRQRRAKDLLNGAHGGAKGKGIGAAFFGDRSTLKADVQKGASFTFEVGTAAGEAADKAAPAAPAAHRGKSRF